MFLMQNADQSVVNYLRSMAMTKKDKEAMAETIRTLVVMYSGAASNWEKGLNGGSFEYCASDALQKLKDMGIPIKLLCLERV